MKKLTKKRITVKTVTLYSEGGLFGCGGYGPGGHRK